MAYRNYGPVVGFTVGTDGNSDFSTIGAALTAATSGDTIFIRPGTYTENPTLKAGVNLTAFNCDALTPNVTINGTCTFTGAGTVTISGIQLQTNSSYFLAVTGTSASVVNLDNCYLNCLNNTGIHFTSSSNGASISLYSCNGNIATTGISMFTQASGSGGASVLLFVYCDITNTGGSTTSSTSSSGTSSFLFSSIGFPITTSSGGGCIASFTEFSTPNITAITLGGSGSTGFNDCYFGSGSASALSVGSTTSFVNSVVSSSNTNAVTGSGTIQYGAMSFSGSSSTINTTTQTPSAWTVQQGGTAASSFTAYAPIVAGTTTTGAFQSASTGLSTSGYVLTSTGSSSVPTFQTVSASGAITTIDGNSGSVTPSSGVITISGGTTGLTTSGSGSTLSLTGTLAVANGGTGVATLTGLALGSGTSALTGVTYTAKSTFSPVLAFGGASVGITYAVQSGTYQRIGNMLFFNIEIVLSAVGSSTGAATVTGLPVAVAATANVPIILVSTTLTTGNLYAYCQLTGSTAVLYEGNISGTQTALTNTFFGSSSQIWITGVYFV